MPTYAYALNNPIANTDPTGLQASMPYDPTCKDICEKERKKAEDALRGGMTCSFTGWTSAYGLQPAKKGKKILKSGLLGCACGGFVSGGSFWGGDPFAWAAFAPAP